jgi:hypothetical protein
MRILLIASSLVALSSASTVDLTKRASSKSASKAPKKITKGSSNTQDGATDVFPGAAGGSTYTYVAGECYDEALNPVMYYSSSNKAWIQDNQSTTNWGGK